MANLGIAEGLSIDSISGFSYSPGDIIMLNSTSTPDGFLPCDGSTITSTQYPSLFSILGTYYDTGSLVCKLPNLNQASWVFPCGTVANDASYGGSSSHAHTTATTVVTSDPYTTAAHNHTFAANTNDTSENHGHSADPGVAPNVSSTLANRSNGSGQGTNLAIYGHTHSWGSAGNLDAANHTHSHTLSFNVSSPDSNHTHATNISSNTNSTTYVPDNVISMRYYIKW